MNKSQLQYVKEQQKLNIFILPSIQKRENLDNSILEELETVYNPNLLGAETEFKRTLADMSLPQDFLEDTRMIDIIRTHGTDAILVYTYLHTKMCNEGYKIKWNDLQEDIYAASLAVYKMDISKFHGILTAFLENKLLFIVTDISGTKWLTSTYQVFMYERVSAKRVRDRIYKKNQSLAGDNKIKIECTLPVFDEEPSVFDAFNSLPFETYDIPTTTNNASSTDNTTSKIPETKLDDENICF